MKVSGQIDPTVTLTRGNEPRCILKRMVGGTQGQAVCFGIKKILPSCGIEQFSVFFKLKPSPMLSPLLSSLNHEQINEYINK